MKAKRVVTTILAALFALSVSWAENPKEEAEREVQEAFEEAERELGQESEEAIREIGEAEAEADREMDEAVQEMKAEGGGQEAVEEAMREMKAEVREAMAEAREAVNEVKHEATEAVNEARHEAEEAVEECTEEQEKRGGGGALTVSLLRFDTGPFEDLNRREADLIGKSFDFDKRTMVNIGGIGYYDVGGGSRVGVGAALGYKYYVSDEFTTIDTSGAALDSAAILRIWPAYLGFNFEKAWTTPKITFFIGGLFGGGVHIVYKKFEDRSSPSAFIEIPSDSTEETDNEFGSLGFATYMAWDLHGGMSFALAPVFRLGIEPYVLFNYAPEGFGTGFGDFFAVSPGIRLRFEFGKDHNA